MAYDTSKPDRLHAAAEFVKGWLEARDVAVRHIDHDGLPVILADAGGGDGPTRRPARPPRRRAGVRGAVHAADRRRPADRARRLRHEGRACGDDVRGPRRREPGRGARALRLRPRRGVRGRRRPLDRPARARGARQRDFAITGEPTELHIGVQAKGVLAITVEVQGVAAHGSTPWLGDNAILKAHDVFRRIETLPFSRESSDLFDRPSINLARIAGGDAFNKVPDRCRMDVDIRYLPGQERGAILAQIREIGDVEIVRCFERAPAIVSRTQPLRARAARRRQPLRAGRRAVDRPRRRLRRDLVPRGGHPGGRVRADRRRPPRTRASGSRWRR